MLLQSVGSQLLIFCAWAAIVGIGMDADATARGEESCNLDIFGFHQAYEVFHDDVDAVFVEVAMIAKAEKIELEALALYHAHSGNVADAYFCEVGLTGYGAQACKLRTVELHPIVVVGVSVFECFEHFGGVVAFIFSFLSQCLQAFGFSQNDYCV